VAVHPNREDEKMARKARFKVYGRMDGATQATVEIDRGADTITVRPYRRRKEYTLPLSTVAEMVIWRIVQGEVAAKRAAKRRAA
jgi:hypothetical protein